MWAQTVTVGAGSISGVLNLTHEGLVAAQTVLLGEVAGDLAGPEVLGLESRSEEDDVFDALADFADWTCEKTMGRVAIVAVEVAMGGHVEALDRGIHHVAATANAGVIDSAADGRDLEGDKGGNRDDDHDPQRTTQPLEQD